jgi:hypothetical protein
MRSDCFKYELELISDLGLRHFIRNFLDECVPPYFYTAPASSSGKYHPKYALGLGGLVRHTKACVIIAEDLLSLEQYETISECYHDEIISALLIHDTFKQGLKAEGGHTKFEHPVYSASGVQVFADKFYPNLSQRVERISGMVLSHMGQWNRSSKSVVVLPKPQTEAQKFVHMCDYLASRQYLTVENIVYEPSEEKEEQQ